MQVLAGPTEDAQELLWTMKEKREKPLSPAKDAVLSIHADISFVR